MVRAACPHRASQVRLQNPPEILPSVKQDVNWTQVDTVWPVLIAFISFIYWLPSYSLFF